VRIWNVPTALLLVALPFPLAFGAGNDDGVDRAILAELQAIRGLLDGMSSNLAAGTAAPPAAMPAAVAADDEWNEFRARGPDLAALRQIQLPANPSDDQVRQYIRAIQNATRGQNTYSDSDPQVRMLLKIGPEKLPLLIEAATADRGAPGSLSNYHLNRAIIRLARDDQKQMIIDALPINNELVRAVVERGWEQDARAVLLAEMKDYPDHLPTEWIWAVANLGDPETYPLLTDYFVNGRNQYWTYEAIKDLPGINIETNIEAAWVNARDGDDCSAFYMAKVAAGYGYPDALDYLVKSFDNADVRRWGGSDVRQTLYRLLPVRGSREELIAWYRQNKDKLIFDPETKTYHVQETKK